MAWLYLIIASFGEIFGVYFINLFLQKKTLPRLILLAAVFSGGFFFLSLAMRVIPMGTAYAVWTGLGAAGAVTVGILFFNEPTGWKRMLFLMLIIGGAVGLKLFG
ncbi:QacE family quaternary ammonium compound efflux SMR transporter [Sporosarcina sp. NCCP-2222]|uniref:DMT family transporter n=1 Tax=Sporosarcina sp. NCCP-2222 TaxID=2935073 RepID=UPI00207DC9B1|nr:multidrug efflux SMR transporter [Sporosarcina sp. NCCP-2222]GKV56371.1 QacE family quaternary ammonium compound efflux SMR transporter [Sporosarcina sp. NCCP-2222]